MARLSSMKSGNLGKQLPYRPWAFLKGKGCRYVKTRCRQLSSKMPQLVLSHCCLVGREVRSQTSLSHKKRSGSHTAVPLITRGAEQKKPETQRTTAQRLSANLAVKNVTPQLTSKNNIEPQTDVARHSLRVQSFVKVSRSHTF